jgi:hypothetical protein
MVKQKKRFTTAELARAMFCPKCAVQENYICNPIAVNIQLNIAGQATFLLQCAKEERRGRDD